MPAPSFSTLRRSPWTGSGLRGRSIEMENISRGPSFGDFVTILTERSMQDLTVERSQVIFAAVTRNYTLIVTYLWRPLVAPLDLIMTKASLPTPPPLFGITPHTFYPHLWMSWHNMRGERKWLKGECVWCKRALLILNIVFSFSRQITCIILTLLSGSMMSRGRPYWTVPALTTPPASASRLYCMPGEILDYLHAVFRMDPHCWGSPGSGSGLGMRIRIQEQGNWPKLTNKPDFQPFKMAFMFYVIYIKYIFQVKSLTRIRIRIGLTPCIRLRIETKGDPKHWSPVSIASRYNICHAANGRILHLHASRAFCDSGY